AREEGQHESGQQGAKDSHDTHLLGRTTPPQAMRSSPLIWLRCMTRRVFGSNGSRRCSTERLFHIRRSPTVHWWHMAKRACVACAHSASSSASLSGTSRPST